MGSSSISKSNDNYVKKEVESLNMTIPEKINETQNEDYPLKSIDNCISKVSRSICKITIREENEIQFGTGFLLKLNTDDNKPIYCLISCEHVISRNLIEKQCTMDIEVYILYLF